MDTSESKIENILFAILLPIISVGISFAISIIKNAFGIMPVLVTLSIILAIVPISCYLAFIIFSSLWQEDIQRRTDEIFA